MPRISFGIIALNAQPFLEYNLRAIYPFAHEIIVVEGAVRTAAAPAPALAHPRPPSPLPPRIFVGWRAGTPRGRPGPGRPPPPAVARGNCCGCPAQPGPG